MLLAVEVIKKGIQACGDVPSSLQQYARMSKSALLAVEIIKKGIQACNDVPPSLQHYAVMSRSAYLHQPTVDVLVVVLWIMLLHYVLLYYNYMII